MRPCNPVQTAMSYPEVCARVQEWEVPWDSEARFAMGF